MAMTGRQKRGVPEGLWIRCPQCKATIFRKEAETRFNVCPECNHHFYVAARDRIGAADAQPGTRLGVRWRQHPVISQTATTDTCDNSVEREVTAGAVANLQLAIGVGDGGGVWIELQRREAEALAVAIDHPQHLRPERHPRLLGRAIALREGRAEGERRGKQSQQ